MNNPKEKPIVLKTKRPRVSVHKFSSCDGCQLAFLNLGEALLDLDSVVEIVHFAEAGPVDAHANVDIAFIEGSISTAHDAVRIKDIRERSQFLVTMGACATSGGVQALRNLGDRGDWVESIYASPEYIDSLDQVSPISQHVKVDFELWGCPVSSRQIVATVRSLLFAVAPVDANEKVCLECKRNQTVCVMVTKQALCMGPATRTGCGALCPSFGRACYGCYGPAENINGDALAQRFSGMGVVPEEIADRFQMIYSQSEELAETASDYRQRKREDCD